MIMYTKDSSPVITKQVVNNIIDVMNDANVTVITIDTLQRIVAECDRLIAEQVKMR